MLRVMVVGLGYWGPNLVRSMSSVDRAQVVAVSDRIQDSLDSITQKYPHVEAVQDFTSVLDSVDAVMIATPPTTHHNIAKACLEAGKHVYIEKPITPSVGEAEDLKRLADERSLTLMVGHIYKYSPAVKRMAEMVASGEIGDVLYASSVRANMGRFSRLANVVWDLLPHDLSVLYSVFGSDITGVSCQGHYLADPEVCDVAYTMLQLENGISCHVHDSWYEPTRLRRFTVVGTRSALILDESSGTRLIHVRKGVTTSEKGYEYFDEGQEDVKFDDGEPLVLECQHFIDCIESGNRPVSDADDGIRILKVIDAVQDSLIQGGKWVCP